MSSMAETDNEQRLVQALDELIPSEASNELIPSEKARDELILSEAGDELILSEAGDDFLLHHATKRGATQTVKSLLSAGRCNVDMVDDEGRTALYFACSNGFGSIAQLLLDNGADMDAVCRPNAGHETALHLAAESGSDATAELLLCRGADIDAVDRYGESALHRACGAGHPGVAELLLRNGACATTASSSDRYAGYTALHFAAWSGLESTVQLLLERKAAVDATASDGLTPLHLACEFRFPKVAERLLDWGARVNVALEEARGSYAKGCTPLHLAAQEKNFEREELILDLVQLLFDWGADVNAMDAKGRTPLIVVLRWWDQDDRKEAVFEAFAKQLVKMDLQGRSLSRLNRQALGYRKEFVENCKDEIARMKRRRAGDSTIAVFDLLTKFNFRLADYAGNESAANDLISEAFEAEFPIYASEIRSRFRQGQKRRDLQQLSDAALCKFQQIPYLCLRIIDRCLTNEDLRNVVRAVELNHADAADTLSNATRSLTITHDV